MWYRSKEKSSYDYRNSLYLESDTTLSQRLLDIGNQILHILNTD